MQRGRTCQKDLPYQERREALRLLLGHRRKLLKFSRKELSARSGVSASTIQAIEEGRVVDPGFFTVIALGVALRIDLSPMMRSLTGPISPQPLVDSAPTGRDSDS